MRTGIEQARIDLAKWDARVADDQAALRECQQSAAIILTRLDHAARTASDLRGAVQRWDFMHARHEMPNVVLTGARENGGETCD